MTWVSVIVVWEFEPVYEIEISKEILWRKNLM